MHLKVMVRVRPLSQREIITGSQNIVNIENNNNLTITNLKVPKSKAGDSRERIKKFGFDYCFEQNTKQDQIFSTVDSIIEQSLKTGNHSCILAYGQTSSGKTHTMMGTETEPGLTPRLCHRVFDYFNDNILCCGDNKKDIQIIVSYLEIYNEKVTDLLPINEDKRNGKAAEKHLRVREHPRKGPYVAGLSQHTVSTTNDLLEYLNNGTSKRKIGSTITNPKSSRSHSVFTISCRDIKLNLIDLAGNERAGNRGYEFRRFREGTNINKSLVALGNVISALADQSKATKFSRTKFVPYRDSVLTWLLKDTLQGNSNTIMIATISPSNAYYSETVNTLRFGQRAKLIVYQPVILEDPKETTIRELKAEIAKLRDLLKLSSTNPISSAIHSNIQMDSNSDNQQITAGSIQNEVLEEEGEFSAPNQFEPTKRKNSTCLDQINSSTAKLLPLINMKSNIQLEPIRKLKRTYSMDRTYTLETDTSKSFTSSQESLQSPKYTAHHDLLVRKMSSGGSTPPTPHQQHKPVMTPIRKQLGVRPKQTALSLKRQAIHKSSPSLKSISQTKCLSTIKNSDAGTVTEVSGIKKIPESKLDTNRAGAVKARSQIVAAVTSRLYNKVKKKDISTSTENLTKEAPKELKICSNARSKLVELTQKALRAHRRKNEETQTDLFPILRVKEVGTDCSDLDNGKPANKDASTMNDRKIEMKDAQVECTLLNQFIENDLKNVLITRSCGVQTLTATLNEPSLNNNISFTKYLSDSCSNNRPIFTEAININISHNYMNSSENRTDSISDDSLDNSNNSAYANVSFPTPDLISNHNSLEQQALKCSNNNMPTCHNRESSPIESSRINHANSNVMEELTDNVTAFTPNLVNDQLIFATAEPVITARHAQNYKTINVLSTYAPITTLMENMDIEQCEKLPDFIPDIVKVKSTKEQSKITCKAQVIENSVINVLPADILEHKKVYQHHHHHHHHNYKHSDIKTKPKKQRLFKAMKEFLEEANILMSNLSYATDSHNCHHHSIDEFDIQVTVNDNLTSTIEDDRKLLSGKEDNATQTISNFPIMENSSSQTTESILVPTNKYDFLLKETCKRLEEKIEATSSIIRRQSRNVNLDSEDNDDDDDDDGNEDEDDDNDNYTGRQRYNPWQINNNNNNNNIVEVEDSSLESNPVTFSDYGSLPRKKHKRQRTPTCSPSAFLRQLTNMRRHIIENSREELLQNCINNNDNNTSK